MSTEADIVERLEHFAKSGAGVAVLIDAAEEIKKLRAESTMDRWHEIARLKVELASTKLRVTGLEATLAPFAKAADGYRDIPGVSRTHHDVELWQQPGKIEKTGLTVGDLRRAASILATDQTGGAT